MGGGRIGRIGGGGGGGGIDGINGIDGIDGIGGGVPSPVVVVAMSGRGGVACRFVLAMNVRKYQWIEIGLMLLVH